tara:strand:- start:19579 stop:20289 length:711 start_codon:yes stop_codon:yes gene_type:complete
MQTNFPEGGIINLTINNMDGNHLPSPAPAPPSEGYIPGMGAFHFLTNNLSNEQPSAPRGHASAERGRVGQRLSDENLTSSLNTSMVVEAKQVQTESITCNKVDGNVFLNYVIGDEKYNTRIHSSDYFWEKNKVFFQDDFCMFYRILKDTFEGNTENMFKWSIIQKNNDKIMIELENTNKFFGFKTTIELEKTESEFNVLRKRILILEKENEKMCEDINLLKRACKGLLENAGEGET